MVYYILTLALLVFFAVWQYIFFIRIYYSNSALCKMKEVRHELMLSIIDKIENGKPIEQISEHQEFLIKVNSFIIDFDGYKGILMKYSGMISLFKRVVLSASKMQTKTTNDEELSFFKRRFVNSILTIFNAIPFGKSRYSLYILRILVSLGFKHLNTLLITKMKLINEIDGHGQGDIQHC